MRYVLLVLCCIMCISGCTKETHKSNIIIVEPTPTAEKVDVMDSDPIIGNWTFVQIIMGVEEPISAYQLELLEEEIPEFICYQSRYHFSYKGLDDSGKWNPFPMEGYERSYKLYTESDYDIFVTFPEEHNNNKIWVVLNQDEKFLGFEFQRNTGIAPTILDNDMDEDYNNTNTGESITSSNTQAFYDKLIPLLDENFGSDYNIYEDNGLIMINTWQEGISEIVVSIINNNNPTLLSAWTELKEGMEYMSNKLAESASSYGVDRSTIVLNMINDLNKDNVLITYVNGKCIYDVVEESF